MNVPPDLQPRLERSLRQAMPDAEVHRIEALPGGASSLTYRAQLKACGGSTPVVIKVAPAGVAPVGHRDVLRQARLLRALSSRPGIAVPTVLAMDGGEPPATAPFFVMAFVQGQSFEPHVDSSELLLPAPLEIERRALSAAVMLALLHAVPIQELAPAGEPHITINAEVDRWTKLFGTVDGSLHEGSAAIGEALLKSAPRMGEAACIVHGDYRLGNMLCADGAVQAIIDWEIWAVSDPRIDLAWLLLTADPSLHPLAIRDAPGMPRPGVLLAEYEQAGGRTVRDLDWFRALALYKMAAAVALIAKHDRRKPGGGEKAESLAPRIPLMLERARATLSKI
jgi:aminoglycoside phosphotransferase (APT) family kinase protein